MISMSKLASKATRIPARSSRLRLGTNSQKRERVAAVMNNM